MTIEDSGERFDHFLDGLMKFRLGRVLGLYVGHER